jgi:sarcosine oxidase subunit delta
LNAPGAVCATKPSFPSCAGEAHIARPLETEKLSDEEWADYLFMRSNPKGAHREQWLHAAGCRRYFNALRDTVTYKISATYKIGETPPSEGKK